MHTIMHVTTAGRAAAAQHIRTTPPGRTGTLPTAARTILAAAAILGDTSTSGDTITWDTTRRRIRQATGLSPSTVTRAAAATREARLPGITLQYRYSEDGGDAGYTITIQEA